MKTTISRLLGVGAIPIMCGLLVLAVLFFAAPAYSELQGKVDVSVVHYNPSTGQTILSDTDQVGAGTTTRTVEGFPGNTYYMTSSATANATSTASVGSQAQIDAVQYFSVRDSYDAASYSYSVVPWLISHATAPDGTDITDTVSVDVNLDGLLSIDFLSCDQERSASWITPFNYEGTLDHAKVGVSAEMDVTRRVGTTDYRQGVFDLDATLNSMDTNDAHYGLTKYNSSNIDPVFSNDSFIGVCAIPDNPASLRYTISLNEFVKPWDWEEVRFIVGETVELAVSIETWASLQGRYANGLTLTSDFGDTISYTLVSSDLDVTFTALAGPTNQPPVADAGANQQIECASSNGTEVTLDGTGSSDPDGDPLTYTWTGGFDSGTVTGATPTVSFSALGSYELTLTVDDGNGGTATDTVTIIVIDTTPPELSVSVSPDTLWPPNHKMVLCTPTTTVSDTCDPDPAVELVLVTSNESDEAYAYDPAFDMYTSEGNTNNDIQIVDGNIYLRSERLGQGDGRIYTITYEATDSSGNTASASTNVTVPHNQ